MSLLLLLVLLFWSGDPGRQKTNSLPIGSLKIEFESCLYLIKMAAYPIAWGRPEFYGGKGAGPLWRSVHINFRRSWSGKSQFLCHCHRSHCGLTRPSLVFGDLYWLSSQNV